MMVKNVARKGAKLTKMGVYFFANFAPLRAILPKHTTLLFLITLLSACNEQSPTKSQNTTHARFFSLINYFGKESSGLTKRNASVTKMVSKDKYSEQKTLVVSNWENEFGLFSSSDINKPAWKNSYRKTVRKNCIDYTALEPELRTRLIRVFTKGDGKPAHITIQNKTSNFLYSSTELLDYYPDSLYLIRKKQKVLLLGTTHYFIKGNIHN